MWPAELRPRANRGGTIEIGEHKLAIDASAMLDFRRELAAVRLFSTLLLLRQSASLKVLGLPLCAHRIYIGGKKLQGGRYPIYFSAVRVTKRLLRANTGHSRTDKRLCEVLSVND